jgi:putative SOS response-associated peptidase YedK
MGDLALTGPRVGAQLRYHHQNELRERLHNRMPVVLKPEAWPVWLGEHPAEVSELKALLAPVPSEEMKCWPQECLHREKRRFAPN